MSSSPPKNRRSFLVEALSTAARVWVVATGGAAGGWFVAGCRDPDPVAVYGGPPFLPDAPSEAVEPAPFPVVTPPGSSSAESELPAPDASAPATASAPTQPQPAPPARKYGGPPPKTPKQGGSARKYGGQTVKYGGMDLLD